MLTETTTMQPTVSSYSLLFSMLHPGDIDCNICIEFIQENSIENSVQDCVPYILKLMVNATLLLAYPKQPCVCLKINMCLICCITLSFQNLLYSSIVTCDHMTVTVTVILSCDWYVTFVKLCDHLWQCGSDVILILTLSSQNLK